MTDKVTTEDLARWIASSEGRVSSSENTFVPFDILAGLYPNIAAFGPNGDEVERLSFALKTCYLVNAKEQKAFHHFIEKMQMISVSEMEELALVATHEPKLISLLNSKGLSTEVAL